LLFDVGREKAGGVGREVCWLLVRAFVVWVVGRLSGGDGGFRSGMGDGVVILFIPALLFLPRELEISRVGDLLAILVHCLWR